MTQPWYCHQFQVFLCATSLSRDVNSLPHMLCPLNASLPPIGTIEDERLKAHRRLNVIDLLYLLLTAVQAAPSAAEERAG
mmetsp:Transcript_58791/g.108559  ORF Transcript_58791/g.108559 Transcript_58791/m.108559 type:complete len:80 (-) Transcript_58791:790-1029(-)